jgi:2-oxoacid:acceptor oxidoreductase delta subunit (pyruvate/2-ketoisovalerate family)
MKINITAKPGSTRKNKTGGWRTFRPKIDLEKCIGCGICARICPEGIIEMKNNKEGKLKPEVDYDYCKGCSVCAAECPVKAIIMELDKK